AEEAVTATMYGVTFEDAMTAILETNGYTFREEGRIVRVTKVGQAAAMPAPGGAEETGVAQTAAAGERPATDGISFSAQEEELEAQMAASATLGNLKWMTPSRLVTPRSAIDGGSESFRAPADWP